GDLFQVLPELEKALETLAAEERVARIVLALGCRGDRVARAGAAFRRDVALRLPGTDNEMIAVLDDLVIFIFWSGHRYLLSFLNDRILPVECSIVYESFVTL